MGVNIILSRLTGMLRFQGEGTAPHPIEWGMEFRIATQRSQLVLKTLNTLLEKKGENIRFLGFEWRALFSLNRPAEAVPAP